ncbi:MAG: endo-1,4-beta-xylanase [Rhodothermaceae bacterium]|nr:endo-1,4-beta-xylanase [Rhodothermaceae bacterium]MYG69824.1 endo-1,4-beta-xylanase [Rhodothermaceae bacterium]MYJ44637.1 endo-1,4-beta-xylanase [Rhodothermaceae bacterium]
MDPRFLFIFLWAILTVGCSENAVTENPEDPEPYTSLRSVAPFPVGVAIQSSRLGSGPHSGVVRTVFNSVTAEYEMKMRHLTSASGSYIWTHADQLVAFANEHDMQIHGHALVWHQSTPVWLENFSGTDMEFEDAVKDYITTVVQRYQDDIVSWDVINEAFEDGSGELRNSVFRRRMGPDYIARLFQYTREADPDVLLFYNDYGTIWDTAKLESMLAMVDDLQARGIPIDGVGLQMHITYTHPPLSNIVAVMDAVVQRGLKIHISEMDVRVNPQGDLSVLTDERSQLQKKRVNEIVAAFMDLPEENQFAITWWGLRDPESWLIDFWGNPEWGLLFDAEYQPKPAYEGFLEALRGN